MHIEAIARTLSILGDKPQRGGIEGLGWVSMAPDPDDPRRVLVNLTGKGRKVLAEIAELGD